MEKLKTLFFSEKLPFFVGLLLSLSLLWPLFSAPYFSHHDDVQVIRLYEMNKCIQDAQIPCRWVPDLGGLYGYPLFNYYGPLAYYFGEIFYLISHDLLISAKIMFLFPFIGSYVFMYLLGRKLWGNWGGALSGIFYSFAPYHALIFYVRGAMGEMWAAMFFPAILWSVLKLKEKPNILNMLLFGLFLSLLIMAHNLSAMLFIPITFLLIGLLFVMEKNWRFLRYVIFSIILALFLSAFYFLPVTFEKSLVHVDTTTYGYFSYTEHFKGLRKLFLDNSWGWGASVREVPGGEKDGMSFQIGWIHILAWILSLYSLKYFWKTKKLSTLVITFSSLIILFSIFMIHPRSEFIWKLIDPLKYLQFPWRFLLVIIFFMSLISGSIISILKTNKKIYSLWGVLVILVVLLNFSHFRPEKFFYISQEDYLKNPIWDQQIKRSIYDYLPIYATEPPAELATARYEILTGDTRINNFEEKSTSIKFNAETKTHSIIRLSQYYFPEWKIFVDGKPIQFDYENHLGLMQFILGVGNHNVEAKLFDTRVRIIGNALTFIGILIFLALFIFQFPKVKKWSMYYIKSLNR